MTFRAICALAGLSLAALLLALPATARADGPVLFMHEASERPALLEALRSQLKGTELHGAEPPSGQTALQRAAAAQAAAIEQGATAAVWIEPGDAEWPVVHVVTASSADPERAPLPGLPAELEPSVLAGVVAHALARARTTRASVPPPPSEADAPPAGQPDGAPAPARQPPAGEPPTAAERLAPPTPPGVAPPPRAQPRHGARPQDPQADARTTRSPYATPRASTAADPTAARWQDPERPPAYAEQAETEDKSPWRHPLIPRGDWRLLAGPVFGASPRVVDSWSWRQPQEIYGLRVMVANYLLDFLRVGMVGAVGSAPGYGPWGTLGGSLMYTNIKSLFRFGVGINVSAILATDEDLGDQFGWLGVEIFPAIEIGWEFNERFGLVVTGGVTATKPGEDDFRGGGQFAIELEVGL